MTRSIPYIDYVMKGSHNRFRDSLDYIVKKPSVKVVKSLHRTYRSFLPHHSLYDPVESLTSKLTSPHLYY